MIQFAGGKGLLEIRSDGTGTDPGLLLRRSDDVTGLDIWHDSSGGGTYGSYFDNRYEDSHWWWSRSQSLHIRAPS